MEPTSHGVERDVSLYDVRQVDPRQEIVSTNGMSQGEIDEVTRLLTAIARWREAEDELRAVSRRYMKLNDTDMKALRFIIFAGHQGITVTPRKLSEHLHISSASTTKMLDRLEAAGHIVRSPHPSDRRALTVTVTPHTHAAASASVGRMQAERFHAAARLTGAEREVVSRFLEELTAVMLRAGQSHLRGATSLDGAMPPSEPEDAPSRPPAPEPPRTAGGPAAP